MNIINNIAIQNLIRTRGGVTGRSVEVRDDPSAISNKQLVFWFFVLVFPMLYSGFHIWSVTGSLDADDSASHKRCGVVVQQSSIRIEPYGKYDLHHVFYAIMQWDDGHKTVREVDATTYELGLGKRFCWPGQRSEVLFAFGLVFWLYASCWVIVLFVFGITEFYSWLGD